ncbi:hypothetical protein EMCRGX_G034844 [Ephydatia muelleri]
MDVVAFDGALANALLSGGQSVMMHTAFLELSALPNKLLPLHTPFPFVAHYLIPVVSFPSPSSFTESHSITSPQSLSPSLHHSITSPHILTPSLLTPSHSQSLTPHTLTFSLPHSSHPHILSPSLNHLTSQSLTPSPHLTVPHSITSPHSQSLTPSPHLSVPHSITSPPQSLTPSPHLSVPHSITSPLSPSLHHLTSQSLTPSPHLSVPHSITSPLSPSLHHLTSQSLTPSPHLSVPHSITSLSVPHSITSPLSPSLHHLTSQSLTPSPHLSVPHSITSPLSPSLHHLTSQSLTPSPHLSVPHSITSPLSPSLHHLTSHSQSLTPSPHLTSHSQSLTPSPHLTFSVPHSITSPLIPPPLLLPSLPHSITSPHILSPSLHHLTSPHILSPSLHHLTSHSQSLTPSPHLTFSVPHSITSPHILSPSLHHLTSHSQSLTPSPHPTLPPPSPHISSLTPHLTSQSLTPSPHLHSSLTPSPHLSVPHSITSPHSQSLTPHTLTFSVPHSSHPHILSPSLLTPSHSQSLTPHTLTFSVPHSSHPHILSPSLLTPSHSQSLTPHTLTFSVPHSITSPLSPSLHHLTSQSLTPSPHLSVPHSITSPLSLTPPSPLIPHSITSPLSPSPLTPLLTILLSFCHLTSMQLLPCIVAVAIHCEALWTLRELMSGLVMCGIGEKKEEFLTKLLEPLQKRFMDLVQRPDLRAHCHDREVQQNLLAILEAMCGLAQSARPDAVREFYEYLLPLLRLSIPVLELYSGMSDVVTVILELFSLVAENYTAFLDEVRTTQLYEVCLALIQSYAKSSTVSRFTRIVLSEEEQCDDLLLFMKLLSHLTTKDYLNFAEQDSNSIQPIDVVLAGLSIILPLMKENLLQFPPLCIQFYTLVGYICEVCPEKIVALPEDMLHACIHAVEIGLNCYGPDVCRLSMDCVKSLAAHYTKLKPSPAHLTPAMQHFLKVVLDLLLLSSTYDMDLLPATAAALYALICAQKVSSNFASHVGQAVVM